MDKKAKVVFDTNVWISIFMKKTLSREFSNVFEQEKIAVYVSEPILKEISKVLMYPKITELLELSGISIKEILQSIARNSTSVNPKLELNLIKEDFDDNKILECALEAKADFIVSGDNHLVKLRKFRNIRITEPREFLEIVKTRL